LTLYHNTKEKGSIVCTGSCAKTWPPLLVGKTAKLKVGPGVKVATSARSSVPDGHFQATYYGKPLYRYAGTASAETSKAKGIGGIWFALKDERRLGKNAERHDDYNNNKHQHQHQPVRLLAADEEVCSSAPASLPPSRGRCSGVRTPFVEVAVIRYGSTLSESVGNHVKGRIDDRTASLGLIGTGWIATASPPIWPAPTRAGWSRSARAESRRRTASLIASRFPIGMGATRRWCADPEVDVVYVRRHTRCIIQHAARAPAVSRCWSRSRSP